MFGVFLLAATDMDDVAADIEYVIDLIGPDHVGLGSDLYGLHNCARGLEDISKVPAVTGKLVGRGHSDEVILKVLGGNFMRVFEQVWERQERSGLAMAAGGLLPSERTPA